MQKYIDNGWLRTNCGCYYGIQRGGEEPVTCKDCWGSGIMWVSPGGRLAEYPGGPFRGQLSKQEHAALKFKTVQEDYEIKLRAESRQRNITRIVMVPRDVSGGVQGVYDYRVEYAD